MKRVSPLKKLGKQKGEEGYGRGTAAIAFDDDVLLDEESLVARLLECLEAPDYRPPTLPNVAMDLMRLSQQADVSIDDVVKLLESDGLIAGRVLKLAGSPVYAGAAKLSSLRDALMRLGLRTLRDIVMEIALNLRVFKSADYTDTMELLRRHSTATAHLARVVSRHTPMDDEYAFLAGLLHDAGTAGTLLALSERKGKRATAPDLIAIWPAVDRVHGRAGDLMAEQWELPLDIRLAIASHHQVLVKSVAHPLAAIVAIANELAHDLGFGLVPKEDEAVEAMTEMEKDCVRSHTAIDRSSAKTLEHARKALDLGEESMQCIEREATEILRELG